jgi:hypothetical protein
VVRAHLLDLVEMEHFTVKDEVKSLPLVHPEDPTPPLLKHPFHANG